MRTDPRESVRYAAESERQDRFAPVEEEPDEDLFSVLYRLRTCISVLEDMVSEEKDETLSAHLSSALSDLRHAHVSLTEAESTLAPQNVYFVDDDDLPF